MGRTSMVDPERGALEAVEVQRGTQFLKSNRITLAYGLTSTKGQTFIKASCFPSSYFQEYVDFAPFSGALGGMTTFDPFGSGMVPRPRLIGICVYLLNLKDDVCTDYFQKVHANCPLHRRIISQIQTKRPGVGVEAV